MTPLNVRLVAGALSRACRAKISRMLMSALVLLCILGVGGCGRSGTERVYDLSAASEDMRSLGDLCVDQPYRCLMASSYDRSGGNDDKGKSERALPNGRVLVAEADGPGCIQRIWATATGQNDQLFFFFDGEKTPRVVSPIPSIIGGTSEFPYVNPFCEGGRAFSYLPMPFEKSLRIEGKIGPQAYYQVTWRQFDDRRGVTSLPVSVDSMVSNAVLRAGEDWHALRDGQEDLVYRWERSRGSLLPGQKAQLIIGGEGVIRRFKFSFRLPDEASITAQNTSLRRSLFRAYWDGEACASVAAPLGAFFCNAWRQTDFLSQPFSSSNGTYTCRFPMPFVSGAVLEVENRGDWPMELSMSAGVTDLPAVQRTDLRYFHAAWSSSTASGEQHLPHTVLTTSGRGHYVGCSMSVESGERSYMILEGDETIRVDGETEPSHRGTGLEDYFNGAFYYFRGLDDFPWHGVLERVPYRTLQYRFHVVDAIPFRKRFEMSFERGDRMAHPGSQGQITSSSVPGRIENVAYYYLSKPTAVATAGLAEIDVGRCAVSAGELMAMLFSLESANKPREAERICRQFAEDHAESSYAGVVNLRRQLYGFAAGGSERKAYLETVANNDDTLAAQQAEQFASVEESNEVALVGFQGSTKLVAYVDGQRIGESTHYARYNCFPVHLAEGPHTLAIEVASGGRERWIQAAISGSSARIGGKGKSDAFYEDSVVFLTKPEGWPLPVLTQGLTVDRKRFRFEMRVPEAYATFEPNAYVDMQSGPATIIRAHPDQMSRTLYVVRQFDW